MNQQNSLNQPKKSVQCQPNNPMLYLAVWLLISNHDCDTYQNLKRTTLSIAASSPSVFSLMSELNPRSIGRRTARFPVKLKQLLPTVKAVDSVGMTVADMDRSLEFPKVPSFKRYQM